MLKLKKYKVTDFRSVKDSGWIETDVLTALIGVNESGKTNLLLPLWKLHPANDGAIEKLSDYPRGEYVDFKQSGDTKVFISASFETDTKFQLEMAALTKLSTASFKTVEFDRLFNEKFHVRFPDVKLASTAPSTEVVETLSAAKDALATDESNNIRKASLSAALEEATAMLQGFGAQLARDQLQKLQEKLSQAPINDIKETTLGSIWTDLIDDLKAMGGRLGLVHPDHVPEVRQAALKYRPSFVYYSNYGNLDSEIYLPHVIENLSREGLGPKEAAKARTLRVLFSFVGIEPKDILELGRSLKGTATPTTDQIADAAEKTKERSILLQSAGTKLTKEFQTWWKQGDYKFRFEADGDHFRIWVSDAKRPEEVELEARSTGLQWFLSFFLVFLVESKQAHRDAILLLDEPGMSLHPLAQKDLSAFFEGLSKTNQLLFTTHSPFLVDPDKLDQVRAVYIDATGATAVSANLRAGKTESAEGRSVYAVHSALGLSISDAMLQGCTNIVVEGPSDQLYMTGIKTVLIALGKIRPQRELVFFPGGGAKGVNALVPILSGAGEAPPFVLLDSDAQGLQFGKNLLAGPLYAGNASLIKYVGELLGRDGSEIEDLLPQEMIADAASRMFKGDEDFRDVAEKDSPIVPQIEAYATKHGLLLPNGWKVDLARAVKQKLLKSPESVPEDLLAIWTSLFTLFVGGGSEAPAARGKSKAKNSA